MGVSITKFTAITFDNGKKYCADWLRVYAINLSVTYGLSIITMTINVLVCMLFNYTATLEKHHTTNDQTSS
jgi:hypothetical protein